MIDHNKVFCSTVSYFDDINNFWQWIDDSKMRAGGIQKQQLDILRQQLVLKDIVDIVRWHQLIEGFKAIAHKNKLWMASDIMNGGISEDGFEYFKAWLIAQGRKVYQNALVDPDSLADVIGGVSGEVFECEEFLELDSFCYFERIGILFPEKNDYARYFELIESMPLSHEQMYKLFDSINFSDVMDKDIDLDCGNDDFRALFPKLLRII